MSDALVTLYVTSMVVGWPDTMYHSSRATHLDMQSKEWVKPYLVYFFIIFMLIGSYFLNNLFIGVVISSYNRYKEENDGLKGLDDDQKDMIFVYHMVMQAEPKERPTPPKHSFMRPFFVMYRNIKLFEPLVYLTILLNTVALCLVWPGQSTYTKFTLETITTICFALYVSEAIIKIAAMRKLYFDDLWNRFDFIVVLLSILFLLLKIYASLNLGLAITGIRAFRFLKLLKGRLSSLWLIVKTFMVALQPLMSVGCMLILVLYIYTIAGVQIFALVMQNDSITEELNFQTFPKAALTLFVVLSGDGWTDILQGAVEEKSIFYQCLENPTYQDYINAGNQTVGCGPGFKDFFFYSYFLIMNQILLKLFIAIICSTYDDLQEKAKIPANSDYLDLFVKMWSNVDVKATGYISVKELDSFIKSLGTSSLGYPKHLAKSHIGRQKFNGLLELPVYCYNECGYFYSFQDVLDSLVSHLVISHFVKRRLKQERETALMAGANIYEEPEEGEKQKKQKPLVGNGLILFPLHHLQGRHVNRALHFTPKKDVEGFVSEINRKQIREELIKQLNDLIQRKDVHKISIIAEIEEVLYERRQQQKKIKDTEVKPSQYIVDPILTSKQISKLQHCLEKWHKFVEKADRRRRIRGIHQVVMQEVSPRDDEQKGGIAQAEPHHSEGYNLIAAAHKNKKFIKKSNLQTISPQPGPMSPPNEHGREYAQFGEEEGGESSMTHLKERIGTSESPSKKQDQLNADSQEMSNIIGWQEAAQQIHYIKGSYRGGQPAGKAKKLKKKKRQAE